MLKKTKRLKIIKKIFLNKTVTKLIKIKTEKIKSKYFLDIYSGNNYITNFINKKKKYLQLINIENNKNIKKIFFLKKALKIKKNKNKKNKREIKKNKKNIIVLNPPYLKYRSSNLKKNVFEPAPALTNFKKEVQINKEIKWLKKFLKKKSKILIENKNYEKTRK